MQYNIIYIKLSNILEKNVKDTKIHKYIYK